MSYTLTTESRLFCFDESKRYALIVVQVSVEIRAELFPNLSPALKVPFCHRHQVEKVHHYAARGSKWPGGNFDQTAPDAKPISP